MDVRVADLYCRRRVQNDGTPASHNRDRITCSPVRYAFKAIIVHSVSEFDSIARPSELQRLIIIQTSFRCSETSIIMFNTTEVYLIRLVLLFHQAI